MRSLELQRMPYGTRNLLNVILLSDDNVCDKEVSAACVSVIPGIVVGLTVGLNTDGYGSQQRCVLSSL